MPFMNQRKGENDHRKYFKINLHERMLLAGSEPMTFWSPPVSRTQLSHRGWQHIFLIWIVQISLPVWALRHPSQDILLPTSSGLLYNPAPEIKHTEYWKYHRFPNKATSHSKSTPYLFCPRMFSLSLLCITVDSHYLEFQGTLWNTLRYPFCSTTKQPHLTNICVIGLLKLDILKILWKRGEIAP